MPSCSAPNCTNSSKKGSRLFRFPKDKTRRNIWIKNCNRDDWSPTPCSVLCEGHFEESEFELHRLDGWKKLRPYAIPTIFHVSSPPKKTFQNIAENQLLHDDTHSIDKFIKERLAAEHSYNSKVADAEVQQPLIPNNSHCTVDETKQEAIFSHKRCELKIKKLKTRNRDLQRQNQKLSTELSYLAQNLAQFLTNDQITHLKYNTQMNGRKGCIIPWDEETLNSSERLFLALGKRGYQYLRDTGYPLPSRRTLIRHRMEKQDKSQKQTENATEKPTEVSLDESNFLLIN